MADSRQFSRRRRNAAARTRRFEELHARLMLAGDTCRLDEPIEEPGVDIAALFGEAFYAADAGSTIDTAYDLGELAATRTLAGTVGGLDPRDVMHFSLATESTVSIGLDGLQADIDMYLFDADGQLVASSRRWGSNSESISDTLAAGDYYILVAPWRWSFSSYQLTVGAAATTPVPVTPDPPVDPIPPDPAPSDPTPTDPADPSEPVAPLPDVPYFGSSNEWNVNDVNAPEAWAAHHTGEGVIVAVVDTGVDINHPDLMSQLWVNAGEIAGNGIDDDGNGYVDDVSGWDFASGDNNPDDGNGHGTHVAGTIAAANNGVGSTGIAPDATIMPVRVLGDNGSGTASGVAAGIRYAVDMGADIINPSLGGSYSSLIYAAIEYAVSRDVLVVAAAGNESASTPGYPARFASQLAGVISVGAYSSSGTVASFSNDVGSSGAVQVDAPGVGIYSTYPDGRYARLSGTSMAAPHVAGLAALALSANPNLSAAELRNVIVAGADDSISGSDAVGGINAAWTVALAAAGQTSASTVSGAATAQASGEIVSARRILASSTVVANARSPISTASCETSAQTSAADSLPMRASSPQARTVRDLALAEWILAEDSDQDSLTGIAPDDEVELWDDANALLLALV